jgi:alpha-tubulin suppressor-like RCC1 family protein
MKWIQILLLIGFVLALRCNLARAAGSEATATPTPGRPAPTTSNTGWATQVSADAGHTCALTVTGGVKCWGDNTYGQLGDGTTQQRLWPVDVVGLTADVRTIAAGWGYTCAVTDGGELKCWGMNYNGQLGDGTTTQRLTPVAVVGLEHGVSTIAAGAWHACALIENGGVKCWGDNAGGQLGDGTTVNRLTPIEVVGVIGKVAALSAGYNHTCAVTSAGTAYCWGWNTYGKLGDGTTTNRSIPVIVDGLLSGVRAISAGNAHACAGLQIGAAKCWGGNPDGRLMFDPFQYLYPVTPVDVAGLQSGVATLSAGGYHTCTSRENGGAKCWGNNESGQLGDGTTAGQRTAVDVVGLSGTMQSISAGSLHTCAVTAAGGVKCWGDNHRGQLGDGTTISQLTPVDVLIFDCAGVSEIPQAECRALVALFDSTNVIGRNLWYNTTGWLRNVTPCSWYGVTCAAGHVSGLDLHSNNLGGTLPAALGDLAGLQTLDLSNNWILGALPPELGRLSALQTLDLSRNRFQGTLPAEWGNLAALQSLNLAQNILSPASFIPAEWGRLTALRSLNLQAAGSIGGSLPPELGRLTALEYLDLSHNYFDGALPAEWGDLAGLQYLDLSNNGVWVGPLPARWGNLRQLRTLNIRGGQLSGPLPFELGQLAALEELDLSSNQITGPLPPTLGHLDALQTLNLSQNQLSGPIPPELGQLPKLVNLLLNDNLLSGPIPPELGDLAALQGAALDGAASNAWPAGWLPRRFTEPFSRGLTSSRRGLPNNCILASAVTSSSILRPPPQPPCCGYLDLASNRLGGFIPPELGRLAGLNFLDLAGNRLRGPVPTSIVGLAGYWRNFGHNLLDAPEYPDIAATQTVPPTDVQVAPVGTYAILTWTPISYSGDGGYYEISYAPTSYGPFLVAGHTADKMASSSIVTDLLPGRAYYFRVRTFTPAHTFIAYTDPGPSCYYTQQNDLWSSYSVLASYDAHTATITPSLTPTTTATPTATVTPTPTPTATATSTPVPGLMVHGRVSRASAAGPGLPAVWVWISLGPDAWQTVAVISDADGRYATGFIDIAGAELITVQPVLEGYTFDPPQVVWQHAAGFEDTVRDFVAVGAAPTATETPSITPTVTSTATTTATSTRTVTATATSTVTPSSTPAAMPTATPYRRWLPLIRQ